MHHLTKIALAWAFLAWLATTWIGAVMGFLFAWAGILLIGGIAAALGLTARSGFPAPTAVLWSLWVLLLALAAMRLAIGWRKADLRRVEHSAALIISLVGIALVVNLSLAAMKDSWP